MKNWAVKSVDSLNDAVNSLLSSTLELKSEFGSSSESLLTLLNASIKTQQSRFMMNASQKNHSSEHKYSTEDEEVKVQVFAGQELESDMNEQLNKSSIQVPLKKARVGVEVPNQINNLRRTEEAVYIKKKKKHRNREKAADGTGDNSGRAKLKLSTMDSDLQKKPQKRKHKQIEDTSEKNEEQKYFDIVNVDPVDDRNNSHHKIKKKKRHKRLNLTEVNNEQINSNELIEHLVYDEPRALHKKPKKKKRKHSDELEVEDDNKKNGKPKHEDLSKVNQNSANLTNNSHLKIKEKKRKKSSFAKIMNKERVKSASPELKEPLISDESDASHKKPKKRKHKHSVSEVEDNYEKNTKHKDLEAHDENCMSGKTKRKKKDKRSSLLEMKDGDKMNYKKYYLMPIKEAMPDKKDALEENKSKVIEYINESLNTVLEKRKLSDEDASVLQNLYIVVSWVLPISHTIETRLSHPTKKQYEQFKELDIKMKQGPYSKEEDQKIRENWEEFCREHNLQASPTLFFPAEGVRKSLLRGEQRINFVRYLGRGLEHRMLFSIYNRFLLLFSTHKKGKFTPEEDNIILTYAEHSDIANKYSVLSSILHRSRELIKKRHRILQADDEKFSWNMRLFQDLVNNLLEVTGKQNVEELKEASIESQHWKEMQTNMSIPAQKLKRKWDTYIYPRLFVEEYNTLNDIRIKLIKILDESNEHDRKNISWNQLAQNFNGFTGARLYKIFYDMVDQFVPKHDRDNFRALVICLKQTLPHILQRNTKLARLIYHNGILLKDKVVLDE